MIIPFLIIVVIVLIGVVYGLRKRKNELQEKLNAELLSNSRLREKVYILELETSKLTKDQDELIKKIATMEYQAKEPQKKSTKKKSSSI